MRIKLLYSKILKILFFSNNGYFNWLCITALVAIGTFIWNVWFNKHKFKADLISKSRIEWMNQVRPLIAKYVAAVPIYIYMYNRYFIENNGSLKKLNYKMDEIEKLYNELNLYIPDTRGASCLN